MNFGYRQICNHMIRWPFLAEQNQRHPVRRISFPVTFIQDSILWYFNVIQVPGIYILETFM